MGTNFSLLSVLCWLEESIFLESSNITTTRPAAEVRNQAPST